MSKSIHASTPQSTLADAQPQAAGTPPMPERLTMDDVTRLMLAAGWTDETGKPSSGAAIIDTQRGDKR